MNNTDQENIDEARTWPREMEGALMNDLADALIAKDNQLKAAEAALSAAHEAWARHIPQPEDMHDFEWEDLDNAREAEVAAAFSSYKPETSDTTPPVSDAEPERDRIGPCRDCGETLVGGKHGQGWITRHLITGDKQCATTTPQETP